MSVNAKARTGRLIRPVSSRHLVLPRPASLLARQRTLNGDGPAWRESLDRRRARPVERCVGKRLKLARNHSGPDVVTG